MLSVPAQSGYGFFKCTRLERKNGRNDLPQAITNQRHAAARLLTLIEWSSCGQLVTMFDGLAPKSSKWVYDFTINQVHRTRAE